MVQFSLSDLASPADLERVLQQFDSALDRLAAFAVVQPRTRSTTTTPTTPSQPAAKSPLILPTTNSNVVQTPTQAQVSPTGGVTSITGTAHQIIASASTGDITLSTPQNIDLTSAVQFGSIDIAGKFDVNGAGLPAKSNNVILAGQGYALIVATGFAGGQAGAVNPVATFTTTASGGNFEVGGYIDMTAFTAGTVTLLCDYTDPSGTAQTLTIPLTTLAGTIITAVASAIDAHALVVSVATSGANVIKVYTVVAAFTGTYSVYGWIKEVV